MVFPLRGGDPLVDCIPLVPKGHDALGDLKHLLLNAGGVHTHEKMPCVSDMVKPWHGPAH
jgi:hypothetical protein